MDYRSEVKDVSFLEPQYANNNIPVIFSCCKDNVSEVAVSIASIIRNSDIRYNYDIVVLHNDLELYDEDMIIHIEGLIEKENITLRFQYIEHNFQEGYIHIDAIYPAEKLLRFFAPIIMKRYNRIISIIPGTILEETLVEIITSDSSQNGYRIYTGDEEADVVCMDSECFRMKYSVKDIASAITRDTLNSDMAFFNNLLKDNSINKKDSITSYTSDDKTTIFWEYAKRTPFYEKFIYAEKKVEVSNCIEEKNFSGVYLFPFERIPQGADVVIYGNGNVGKQYCKQVQMTSYCNIVAILDKREEEGVLVPSEIQNLDYDYIVIAIANKKVMIEIVAMLRAWNVEEDKIICELEREIFL